MLHSSVISSIVALAIQPQRLRPTYTTTQVIDALSKMHSAQPHVRDVTTAASNGNRETLSSAGSKRESKAAAANLESTTSSSTASYTSHANDAGTSDTSGIIWPASMMVSNRALLEKAKGTSDATQDDAKKDDAEFKGGIYYQVRVSYWQWHCDFVRGLFYAVTYLSGAGFGLHCYQKQCRCKLGFVSIVCSILIIVFR